MPALSTQKCWHSHSISYWNTLPNGFWYFVVYLADYTQILWKAWVQFTNIPDFMLYQLEWNASFLDLSKVRGLSPTPFKLLLMQWWTEILLLFLLKTLQRQRQFHLHHAQMPRIQGLWCFHKLIPCTMCLIPVKMAYYGTKNKLLIAFKIFRGFCRDANTYFAENPRNRWTHFKYHSGRFSYPGKKNNIPYLKDFRTGLEMG